MMKNWRFTVAIAREQKRPRWIRLMVMASALTICSVAISPASAAEDTKKKICINVSIDPKAYLADPTISDNALSQVESGSAAYLGQYMRAEINKGVHDYVDVAGESKRANKSLGVKDCLASFALVRVRIQNIPTKNINEITYFVEVGNNQKVIRNTSPGKYVQNANYPQDPLDYIFANAKADMAIVAQFIGKRI